jgi:hypothetical protein
MRLSSINSSVGSIYRSLVSSKSVVSAKKKTIRSRIIKSILFAVGSFFAIFYLIASASGYIAYLISIDPKIEYNEPLRAIFGQMSEGNNAVFGSVAIISLLSYIFFAPLVGTATLSLISEDESLTLPLARGHKFFDSLFLNLFSGVGVLQLLIGTGIVSILSIEGARLIPVILFIFIWIISGLLSTTLGWLRERAIQKVGFWKTLGAGIAMLGLITLLFSMFLLNPLSQAYSNFIIWSSKITSVLLILTLFLGLVSLMLFLLFVGHNVAQRVLFTSFPREGRKVLQKNSVLAKSNNLFVQGLLLVNIIIFRTRDARRTILVVSLLAVLAILIAPPDETTLTGIVIGATATFNLAWLANFYGLSGSGNTFLATKNKTYKTLPIAAFIYGTLVPMVFLFALFTLALALNRFELEIYQTYMLMSLCLAPLTALLASILAIYKPYRARLEGRGDVLIPPLTSLLYLALFITLGGTVSFIVSKMLYNYQSILLSIFTALLTVLIGRIAILSYWNSDNTRYKIMKMSNGD